LDSFIHTLCKEVVILQIRNEIIVEARRHGIKDNILRELIKEYRRNKRREPKNFADLIEGSVC